MEMEMRKLFAALMLIGLSACPAVASDRGFVNYDGDTLRATFRIENIDAPEIKGQCDSEKKLAIRAKDFTAAWMAKGRVTIHQAARGRDKYGRILARFERDGEDLGETLIKAGLARPWKGKREKWCPL
jgi:endonuclease YncB( thermonuclease family)